MSDAIVLLSGGIDSATALAMTRATGHRCHALSFRYGQRHAVELAAAARVATALGAASHETIDLDLRAIGGSALTADIAVPKGRDEAEIGSGIPVTYVPARNTIFLAYAIALAEVRRASEIVVGVNVLDSSGYPDCRPEWLAAMQEVARLGTKAGVERRPVTIRAPLIKMSKAEIIRAGVKLGIDYGADAFVLRPRAVRRRLRRLRRVPAPAPRLRGRRGARPDDLRVDRLIALIRSSRSREGSSRRSRTPTRQAGQRQSVREFQGPPKAPVPRNVGRTGATRLRAAAASEPRSVGIGGRRAAAAARRREAVAAAPPPP